MAGFRNDRMIRLDGRLGVCTVAQRHESLVERLALGELRREGDLQGLNLLHSGAKRLTVLHSLHADGWDGRKQYDSFQGPAWWRCKC